MWSTKSGKFIALSSTGSLRPLRIHRLGHKILCSMVVDVPRMGLIAALNNHQNQLTDEQTHRKDWLGAGAANLGPAKSLFRVMSVDGNLCDSHRNLKQLSIDRLGASAVGSIIHSAVGRRALSMRVGRRTSLGFYYTTIVPCQLNLCLFCCIILCTFRDKHRNYYQLLSGSGYYRSRGHL